MIEIPPALLLLIMGLAGVGALAFILVAFAISVCCIVYLIEEFEKLARNTRLAKWARNEKAKKFERDIRDRTIRELKAEQIRREIDQAKQQEELRRI